ncbi:hypothetical protein [Phyllobacterium sp. 628]|uniref:hypothetical protein n=1 Tax=Phyllobacterium sp. 628 TaxID=2718938 RepID=UPI001662289B|nr:hypothetical protein [Phyllobacterium sp. 628]
MPPVKTAADLITLSKKPLFVGFDPLHALEAKDFFDRKYIPVNVLDTSVGDDAAE